MFHSKCLFSQAPQSAPHSPPTAILDPSETCGFQGRGTPAIKVVVIFCVWVVMAHMGRLVTRLGHLGRPKFPKSAPEGFLSTSLFHILLPPGRDVAFPSCLLWFLGRSEPRTAHVGAVETQFSISAWLLKL